MSTYINPNKPIHLHYEDQHQLLDEYMRYLLTVKATAKRSINSYIIDLQLWLRFLARLKGVVPENTPIEEIKISGLTKELIANAAESDVITFLYYLADDRDNAPSTIKHKLVSLNSFYGYLQRVAKVIEKNPLTNIDGPAIKAGNRQPKYLTVDQSEALLNAVGGEFPERDYCILVLFLTCGMRLSELTGIDMKDLSETTIKIRHGKGAKERTAYLNEMAISALADYREARDHMGERLIDKEALFVSKRTGKRIGNRQVEKMMKKYIAAAGLLSTGATPHTLRHSAASQLYQAKAADLPELARLLGHSSTKTTEIYTHLNEQRLAEVVEKSPLMAKCAK